MKSLHLVWKTKVDKEINYQSVIFIRYISKTLLLRAYKKRFKSRNIRVHTLFLKKASEGFTVLFIKCKTVCTLYISVIVPHNFKYLLIDISTTLSVDENFSLLRFVYAL